MNDPRLPSGADVVRIRNEQMRCPACGVTWVVTVAYELGDRTVTAGCDACPECDEEGELEE